MTFTKKITILIFLLILIAGGFILINSKKKEFQEEATAYIHKHIPMNMETQKSKTDNEIFTAKVAAQKNPKLSTKISGYIEKIYVKENQRVKKGQILVSIDAGEYQNSLKQLDYSVQAAKRNISALEKTVAFQKLDMQQAFKTYKSNKKIFQAGGISLDQLTISEIVYEQKNSKYLSTLDQIESNKLALKSQEALLSSKKSLEKYYSIYAPFDGIVESLYLSQGDLTQGNKPVLSLLSHKQKLTFTYANDLIKDGQDVYFKGGKIGSIGIIYPSAQRYLKVAEISLDKPLDFTYNSLISIEVDIK
ncbi:HlyD family secretion protein [Sulfurimonas marina]|uniref:Biotin/lipoyl-binding protein n=1 Tax=Sulfurimonas marina TaxID=2590551 RepID=A0A7M1AVS1_9BACT|nr:biotin/lipoyl-binding protein [Sulfurimonas marina]QOP41486.1 biotin/lipoyl-binding protein [Sulfurimonas marina]